MEFIVFKPSVAAENHCLDLFILTLNSGFGMIDGLMWQIYLSNEDFHKLELRF